MPQLVVSAADAIAALTDEQRAAPIAAREESLRVIDEELDALRPTLALLETQARDYQKEFMRSIDSGTMPPQAIVDWFESADEEFGRLRFTIREFEEFRDLLIALE